jgi:hypothetical protein
LLVARLLYFGRRMPTSRHRGPRSMPAPLSQIRVLELSRILAGPWAGQTLADLGASVIKVERPGTGDDTRSWGPPFAKRMGVAVTDVLAGLYAVIAIQGALAHRANTGEGQHIDIALLDVQAAALANQALNYLVSGRAPGRLGNAHPNIVPYEAFQTSDGYIILAVGNDGQFARFCEVAGRRGRAGCKSQSRTPIELLKAAGRHSPESPRRSTSRRLRSSTSFPRPDSANTPTKCCWRSSSWMPPSCSVCGTWEFSETGFLERSADLASESFGFACGVELCGRSAG